jgi:hypothetical protein
MSVEGEEEVPVVEAEAPVIEGEIVAPEPEVAVEPEPGKKPKRKDDPLVAEITKLRARVREGETIQETLRREAADARALAERLAKRDGGDGAPKSPPAPSQALDDAEVDRRAEHKLFLRDVAHMRQIGEEAFGKGDFDAVVQNLTAYGADNDEFIRQVMAVDRSNAHALLKEIAEDPARAIGLVNMNPTQRIAELTRMSIGSKTAKVAPEAPAKPASKAISAAPKPAPAISSSSSTAVDWRSDKATDKEFDAGFDEMMKRRAARR